MSIEVDREAGGSALREFLRSEAAGGMLLIAATAAALFVANSGLAPIYHDLLASPFGPEFAPGHGPLTLHSAINDGLMAVFFLLVGLEIKREFLDGQLSNWDRRRLPLVAAAVGMAVPAFMYLLLVAGEPTLDEGWAIPAATDIAFAIGVLALLGRRAPTSLKLFLTTVAIADDLGAVAIIAIAYTAKLNLLALAGAAAVLLVLYALGKSGVTRLWIYLMGAALLWYTVLLSGVHPTVAGVLAASAVPLVRTRGAPDSDSSPLHRLERALAPWVAFLIVPIFGFANAGLSFEGLEPGDLAAPLPLGIAAGLFLGKQIGIFGAVWLSVQSGWARPWGGVSWLQVYGVSVLCGIGFTMSLFISGLAFPTSPLLVEEARIGILLGSFLSALVGFGLLRFAPLRSRPATDDAKVSEG